MNIPGKGLSPSLIRPEKRDDLGTVEFLGTKVVKTHPELKEWGVGSPAKIDLDALITGRGHVQCDRADEARRGLSDRSKAISRSPRPAIISTSKTRCSSTS